MPGLIGREADLARLRALVGSRERLVTLHGPGGIGKSTLLRVLVAETSQSVLVPASAARSVAELEVAIAQALDVCVAHGGAHELEGAIASRLKRGGTLVLDGIDRVGAPLSRRIEGWIEASPTLTVVAGSRTVLGIPYERVVPLGPLGLAPDGEDGLSPAARLLIDLRGMRLDTASDRELTSAARIVAALGGVPFAIELVGRRAGALLSLEAELHDLRKLLHDHLGASDETGDHPLDRVMRWSIDLLEPSARADLIALSIVRGPFRVEQAAALLGVEEATAVAARVRRLVDRSLVMDQGPTVASYSMLETVRACVRDQIPEGAAEAFAVIATARAERQLQDLMRAGADEAAEIAASLVDDVGNLEDASARARHRTCAIRAAVALDSIAHLLGTPVPPGALDAALERPSDGPIDVALEVEALARSAWRAWSRGATAPPQIDRAMALSRDAGEAVASARALALGTRLSVLGSAAERDRADEEEALIALRSPSIDAFAAVTLVQGLAYTVPAQRLRPELEQLAIRHGAGALGRRLKRWLAISHAACGDHARARRALSAIERHPRQQGAHEQQASLYRAGLADMAEGRYSAGAEQFALARKQPISFRWDTWARYFEGVCRLAAGETERAEAIMSREEPRLLELGPVGASGIVLGAMAGGASATGWFETHREQLRDRFEHEALALDALLSGDLESAERALGALADSLESRPMAYAEEARSAHRLLLARFGRMKERRRVEIAVDGSSFIIGGRAPVSLTRHALLGRIALRFANLPRVTHDVAAVFEAGWPGERATAASMSNRVHVALSRLRRMGFDILLHQGAGWCVAPDVIIEHPTLETDHTERRTVRSGR